jgi:polysaccharide export outer membrane protein
VIQEDKYMGLHECFMSHRRVFDMIAILALLVGASWGQTNGTTSNDSPVSTPSVAAPQLMPAQAAAAGVGQPPAQSTDILIGSGDLLEVSVYGAPDFEKKETRVSDDGKIILPLIGAQHVQGLTVGQAQALIARKLADGDFFNDPQVSLGIKEYATQGISVLGAVQKPGVYPMLGPHRLFDALSAAGGLAPQAGRIVTIMHRNAPDQPITINLGKEIQGSVEGNTSIYPGDTIMVSKAGIIYVVGEVKKPGGFVIDHGDMTVLQSLAMAEGANPNASLNSAKLIRTVDGRKQEYPVPLKQILTQKAPDMKLQADDIVFIPTSAGKSAARRSIEAILQTATGIAIYHP